MTPAYHTQEPSRYVPLGAKRLRVPVAARGCLIPRLGSPTIYRVVWKHQKRGLWHYEVAAKWRERAEWF